jgi:hypothetical protein
MRADTVPEQIARLAEEVGAGWQERNEAGAVETMRDASVYFGRRSGFSGVSRQKLLDVRGQRIGWVGDLAVVGWKRRNSHMGDTLPAVDPCLLDHIQDRRLVTDLYLPALGVKLM